jgi:hypothetical protein
VPEVEQIGVEEAAESDYESYLKQRSLNAVLVKAAVVSGAWLALGAVALATGAAVRPNADVVGMDSAGREHPIVLMPMQVGAKK